MGSKDVHIIPIGWESDRAVKPFEFTPSDARRLNAHRIHLVVPNRRGGLGFPEKTEQRLKALDFEVKVHEVPGRSDDGSSTEFQDVLGKVIELCHKEALRDGNTVHINISAGSKIGGFAAGLAGMAYAQTGRIRLYYVQPDIYVETIKGAKRAHTFEEFGMSRGVRNVLALPTIPIVELDRVQWQILAHLQSTKGSTPRDLLHHLIPYEEAALQEYRDLLPGAERPKTAAGRAENRRLQNLGLARLRRLLAPLMKRKLVEAKGGGSSVRILLTAEGQRFAWLAYNEKTL